MTEKKTNVVAVVGPTASGKTGLAVMLGKALGGEVVSADSMQIYRRMDIATAKPTAEEMSGVPHHMIDFVEPGESFSVARYCELAHGIINDISNRGRLPIIAGGTGLYVDSLLGNTEFEKQESAPELRAQITEELEEKGSDFMLDSIREFDPESYERLKTERNPRRIVRCIETYRALGVTQTEINHRRLSSGSPYNAVKIGLSAENREYLYDRINLRVDKMLESGLLDEARAFYQSEYSDTASAAIGYKELLPYLKGELSLDICVENLKRATRRYAKRQLTWFNRDKSIRMYMIDRMSYEEIAADAVSYIKEVF